MNGCMIRIGGVPVGDRNAIVKVKNKKTYIYAKFTFNCNKSSVYWEYSLVYFRGYYDYLCAIAFTVHKCSSVIAVIIFIKYKMHISSPNRCETVAISIMNVYISVALNCSLF